MKRVMASLRDASSLYKGIIAMIVIGVILPVIQTGFFQNSLTSWLATLLASPLSTILYFLFVFLTGSVVSLYYYNKKTVQVCNTSSGSRWGVIGTFFGFFIGVCPACVGLVGVLFPLTVSLTLTRYGWVFMSIAILLQLVSLRHLGGFKNI